MNIQEIIIQTILTSEESAKEIFASGIEETDFTRDIFRNIFRESKKMLETTSNIDWVILTDSFPNSKEKTFIRDLVINSLELYHKNIDIYISRMQEDIQRQKLINASKTLIDTNIPLSEVISNIKSILDINIINAQELVNKPSQVLRVNNKLATKVPTGINKIDSMLYGGLCYGTVSVLTGYNASGKSTIINQVCIAEALNVNEKVFVFSPELQNSMFKDWLYSTLADESDFKNIDNKFSVLKNDVGLRFDKYFDNRLVFWSDESSNAEQILLKAINYHAKRGFKVFVIDNLMKVDLKNSSKNEYESQKRFVNTVKQIANKYGAIIWLIAHPRKPQQILEKQITDECGNKRSIQVLSKITKFDIAGSGDITNLADYVFNIHRLTDDESMYTPDFRGYNALFYILKDRLTQAGTERVNLKFHKDRKRFYEFDHQLNKSYIVNQTTVSQEEIPF